MSTVTVSKRKKKKKKKTASQTQGADLKPGQRAWITSDEWYEVMSPDQLSKIETLVAGHEGGWQRRLIRWKVNSIKDMLQRSWVKFPPGLVALIDGIYYDIDGQHRRVGHIEAGRNFTVQVVRCDKDTAGKLFRLHGSTATRISELDMVRGSDNPQAQTFKKLSQLIDPVEDLNEVSDQALRQVKGLLVGLMAGIGSTTGLFNLIDDDAQIPPQAVKAAAFIIREWGKLMGDDSGRLPLWGGKNVCRKNNVHMAHAPVVLRTLGYLALRDHGKLVDAASRKTFRSELRSLAQHRLWKPGRRKGPFQKAVDESSHGVDGVKALDDLFLGHLRRSGLRKN